MKKNLQRLLTVTVALGMIVLIIRPFAQVRKDPSNREDEEEKEEGIKSPSRVSVQKGQIIISLNPESQSLASIRVAPLKSTTARDWVKAPAVILSAQELVTARNNYVAAQTGLEKAEASVQVMQQESDRLKTLYEDNQNASQRALQSAQGSLRSGEADVRAAQQELALQAAALRQSWGSVIAKWIVDDPPPLDRVFNQQDFLVQVTAPAGAVLAPPDISLELPGARYTQAKLISPFPRVDPRLQGVSSLYLAQNQLGLAPGLNLTARLSVGRPRRGVIVPQQAIVWWQGTAWVYQQTTPGHFVRRMVPSEMALRNGVFVSEGLSPGDQIVTSGAQVLLSEEFRSQIQPED